ncbi:PIR protein [Plasmodium yoelii]|uniref:PIR protein n=2 Tax=Plasmodium yoelii TaxID=5861 RepID=A0AAF0B7I3_PLAYO|nr:PIR protein [Plasmodium yoelii]WBY60539.1 PIR protein [Plasmodium yoelii yoelii]CDU20356.1 YIR protein [Plasmodium yoelii]VTZ81316.1 PIR protein [Plasmodium yoelii]|eukprot:XP_022812777.1 PIR protein [Plasmodium yoelii]
MEDDICPKFDLLRKYLPDESNKNGEIELNEIKDYEKYCPGHNCNTEIEKITIGFLWLLGQCYSALKNKSHNNTNAFFIYLISWFSYKLKQNIGNNAITIKDFYNNSVIGSGKYSKFTTDAYKISGFDEFMDEQNDLMNINIEDMSKFYDAFKLLCNMYYNYTANQNDTILLNSANDFVEKYTNLNNNCNIEGTARSKIFSALSTNYDNFKNHCNSKGVKCKDFPSLPEITKFSALSSGYTSSSSIGKRLFTVLSIFGTIAFLLGISYKYSLFGFRKRVQKQKLREKIKNIKKKINH